LSGKTFDADEMIDYLRAHAKAVITVDGDAIANEVGSPKVLNVALLGAASATGILGISAQEIESALAEKLPPKVLAMNQKALALGAECVKESN
jgi:indolepyruvate ferredoxin oxidoreductase beta subunit